MEKIIKSTLKQHADTVFDAAKSQFGGIFAVVCVIWGVFLIDHIPYVDLSKWLALTPRTMTGAIGIATMPLVHGDWPHIISNTIPLIIMLLTLSVLRPKQWMLITGLITLVSGAMTWVLGSSTSNIVGASALVLGLLTFLLAPAVFYLGWLGVNRLRKDAKPYPFKVNLIPMAVSGVVGFFFINNLIFNLIPVFAPGGGQGVSWLAHWCGAIGGLIVAFIFAKSGALGDEPELGDAEPSIT